MATKKGTRTRTITEQIPDDDDPVDESAPTPETAEILAASGEERPGRQPHVRVNRVDPEDGKPKFLAVVQPALATEDYVKKRWGGGTYICETYGQRQGGKFGYIPKSRQTIEIDTSIPFRGAEPKANGDAPHEPAAPVTSTMDALMQGQLISMFKEQNESRNSGMTMMLAMMQAGQQQSQQMMQLMMTLVTSILAKPNDSGNKELLQALVNAGLNKPDDLDKFIKLQTALKANEPPRTGVGEMLGILREVMDLKSELGGERDERDSMVDMIKTLAPEALGLLRTVAEREGILPKGDAAHAALPPGAPVAVVDPPPGTPAVAAAPAVPPDEWTPLEEPLMQLLHFAQQGAEPRYMVGMALTMANPQQRAFLREKVADPDVAAKIAARFPAWQNQSVWLGEFCEELYAEFFPDAVGDDPEHPDPEANQ